MTKRTMSTGISPKYVKGWDAEKAIREIIQNYLDSRKEFNCEGHLDWRDGMGIAKDYGPGLELRHLALGVSEKDGDTIGKYGEGLKLALLVMAREGRDIEVWANGNVIRPTIEHDADYQTEVMVLNVEPMAPRHAATHTGTSVKFECTEEELEAGKRYFEHYLVKKDDFEWMERGKISTPGGFIFINGAKVGEIPNALFSYHLQERETGDIGNRDREIVNRNLVERVVRKVISETSSTKVMERILLAVAREEEAWEVEIGLNEWMLSKDSRRVWKRAFNKVIGKDAVVSDGNQNADVQARYKGHKILKVGFRWQEALGAIGVETSTEVITRNNGGAKKIALKNLTEEERSNFKTARTLVERHYNETGSVSIAEDLSKMSGASQDIKVNGVYKRSEDRIYLRRSILADLQQTIHVLLHEAVHKHSGAGDCTAEFERALTDVAVGMMMKEVN